MTPTQYQQVKTAFQAAMELPSADRDVSLRRAFPDDETMLAAARALLSADATPLTVIDQPAVSEQFQLQTRSLAHTAIRHSPFNAGY